MQEIALNIFLLCMFGLIVWTFIDGLIQLKKHWPKVKKSWQRTDVFEKKLLYIGSMLFLALPAFKGHPSADYYSTKVIVEVLPALASSFFVVGVIGFMRNAHEVNKEEKT